jgi:hypothetical protein
VGGSFVGGSGTLSTRGRLSGLVDILLFGKETVSRFIFVESTSTSVTIVVVVVVLGRRGGGEAEAVILGEGHYWGCAAANSRLDFGRGKVVRVD